MFTSAASQALKCAWATLDNNTTLTESKDVPFSTLSEFNSSGITLNGGQFTVPAGKWGMFFLVTHSWTGNGVVAGSRWTAYDGTNAQFITPSASYYTFSQAGASNASTNPGTLPFCGSAFLDLPTSHVVSVRLQQYMHTPGVTLKGFLGDAVCGALFVSMDTQ